MQNTKLLFPVGKWKLVLAMAATSLCQMLNFVFVVPSVLAATTVLHADNCLFRVGRAMPWYTGVVFFTALQLSIACNCLLFLKKTPA
jgi:hypothetical protein